MLGIDVDRLIDPAEQRTQIEDYELWPEHGLAWKVFRRSGTQWRKTAGVQRVVWEGLDYAGVEVVMRRCGVPEAQADEVFEQLQVLEDETLLWRNQD